MELADDMKVVGKKKHDRNLVEWHATAYITETTLLT